MVVIVVVCSEIKTVYSKVLPIASMMLRFSLQDTVPDNAILSLVDNTVPVTEILEDIRQLQAFKSA